MTKESRIALFPPFLSLGAVPCAGLLYSPPLLVILTLGNVWTILDFKQVKLNVKPVLFILQVLDDAMLDYDDCLKGPQKCHASAECSNVNGSYSCQCKEGYTGDGYTCQREYFMS
ncbi:Signal peptide, CUB and EGF-like domain-containing protein 3 [Bulinus truncatus]|nr:Signal peptide, CUB and EGF-like domain-containing protein 3 [Bulinus truncatus]